MSIPDIQFKPEALAKASIEIVELDTLYQRRSEFDHDPEKPHRVAFNVLIYFQQGHGAHFLDFSRRPFEPGYFVFVQKSQIHAFDFSARPKGKLIVFTDDFIHQIQNNMKMPFFWPVYLHQNMSPVFKLSDTLQQRCVNLLTEIDQEVRLGEPDSLLVMHLFAAFFLLVERESNQSEAPNFDHQVNGKLDRFLKLVEQQFTQTRNASDYAEQLHVTYKTLNQLCKQSTGKTAKQLIDAYTILEAKRRLVLEKKPIQQLSDEMGFDEVTNFVKYFKKHTLMTPTDFRG